MSEFLIAHIVEQTKNCNVLETLIDLNKRGTFFTEIFAGIKDIQLYIRHFIPKLVNFNSCNSRHFIKLSNILMIKLLKNSDMIISHKIYNKTEVKLLLRHLENIYQLKYSKNLDQFNFVNF